MSETESELKKELGQQRMQQALERIEEAQLSFEAGLADLSTILGGAVVWKKGGQLYDRIKAFSHDVEDLNFKIEPKGGPCADECTVKAELERRRAEKKES